MAIRSITLAAGESYVLPTGATIISATNSSAITSENGCAGDLNNLEDLACYIIVLIGHDKTNISDSTFPYETTALRVTNLTIGDISYPATCEVGALGDFFLGDIINYIQANSSISGIFIDLDYSYDAEPFDSTERGAASTLCFKAIPSLAETIYLTVQVDLIGMENGEAHTTYKAYAIPYADYTGIGKCSCTTAVIPA